MGEVDRNKLVTSRLRPARCTSGNVARGLTKREWEDLTDQVGRSYKVSSIREKPIPTYNVLSEERRFLSI